MSWIADITLSFVQRFCINILKCGPVPKHIAIIMDGNRRFARKTNVDKQIGHVKGFTKLSETLQWCREIGIVEVTVYAFSIENFKRSPEEVDSLMQLVRDKFKRLIEEKDEIIKQGICIRVLGDLSLVPDDIKKIIAEAVLLTKDNDKAFLNIAFAYTSRSEITNAIKTIKRGIEKGLIEKEDIDEELFSKCLYTNKSPDPDLYIRTSGEVRFSDFLLWQNGNSVIYFADVLWPEFSIWNLLGAVFYYQRSYNVGIPSENNENLKENPKANSFFKFVEDERLTELKKYAALPVEI